MICWGFKNSVIRKFPITEFLLAKRKRHGANTGCLFFDFLQEVRHMVGTIKFLCQCDDITTFACAKIIP